MNPLGCFKIIFLVIIFNVFYLNTKYFNLFCLPGWDQRRCFLICKLLHSMLQLLRNSKSQSFVAERDLRNLPVDPDCLNHFLAHTAGWQIEIMVVVTRLVILHSFSLRCSSSQILRNTLYSYSLVTVQGAYSNFFPLPAKLHCIACYIGKEYKERLSEILCSKEWHRYLYVLARYFPKVIKWEKFKTTGTVWYHLYKRNMCCM